MSPEELKRSLEQQFAVLEIQSDLISAVMTQLAAIDARLAVIESGERRILEKLGVPREESTRVMQEQMAQALEISSNILKETLARVQKTRDALESEGDSSKN